MSGEIRLPGRVLTVVIRDDAPLRYCNDNPTYRSVQIPLADQQMQRLNLRENEAVSRCFIEPPEEQP